MTDNANPKASQVHRPKHMFNGQYKRRYCVMLHPGVKKMGRTLSNAAGMSFSSWLEMSILAQYDHWRMKGNPVGLKSWVTSTAELMQGVLQREYRTELGEEKSEQNVEANAASTCITEAPSTPEKS